MLNIDLGKESRVNGKFDLLVEVIVSKAALEVIVESDDGLKLGCHIETLEVVLDQELILGERNEVNLDEDWHIRIDDICLEDLEALAALIVSQASGEVAGSNALDYTIAQVDNTFAGQDALFWDVLDAFRFLGGGATGARPSWLDCAFTAASVTIRSVGVIAFGLIFDAIATDFSAGLDFLVSDFKFLNLVAHSALLALEDIVADDAVVSALGA